MISFQIANVDYHATDVLADMLRPQCTPSPTQHVKLRSLKDFAVTINQLLLIIAMCLLSELELAGLIRWLTASLEQ